MKFRSTCKISDKINIHGVALKQHYINILKHSCNFVRYSPLIK